MGKEVHVCVCVFGMMALIQRISGLQAQSSNISYVMWELFFYITSYVLINILRFEPKGSWFVRVFECMDLNTSVCITEAHSIFLTHWPLEKYILSVMVERLLTCRHL